LQAQLMQVKAQLAQSLVDSRNIESQWAGNIGGVPTGPTFPTTYMNPISPQSSLESIDHSNDGMNMQEIQSFREDCLFQACCKKRPFNSDLGELQALALRMMRN
jgi:hypothetical protein